MSENDNEDIGEDDVLYVSKETLIKFNLPYDQKIIEKSGMTCKEINDQVILALFAMRRPIESFSPEEVEDLILTITTNKYMKVYKEHSVNSN